MRRRGGGGCQRGIFIAFNFDPNIQRYVVVQVGPELRTEIMVWFRKVASIIYGRCSDAYVSSSEYERLKHFLGQISRQTGICETCSHKKKLSSSPPHPPHFSGRCRALGLQKPPIFLLWMAVVDDGRCRPYVAEWADASPMRYGLPM